MQALPSIREALAAINATRGYGDIERIAWSDAGLSALLVTIRRPHMCSTIRKARVESHGAAYTLHFCGTSRRVQADSHLA